MGANHLGRGGPGRSPRVAAIVVGAGRSRRMGGRISKAFLRLGDRPVYLHALERLARLPQVRETVLVLPPEACGAVERRLSARRGQLKLLAVVPGGRRRQDSVLRGVEATSLAAALVAVHDAARPLVDPRAVREAIRCAARDGAAILAVPVRDTIKRAARGGLVAGTLSREALWAAQTPQIFRREVLLAALRRARDAGVDLTDDAAALERLGFPVTLVAGSESNFKITTPEDLRRARAMLASRAPRASRKRRVAPAAAAGSVRAPAEGGNRSAQRASRSARATTTKRKAGKERRAAPARRER